MAAPAVNTAWLIPLPGGPPLKPLSLNPTPTRSRGIMIGRGEACDVKLDDPRVSRPHAQLTEDNGRWRITDQSSRWGTFVNGQRIKPGNWIPIADGDQIQIVPWTFLFSVRGAARQGMQSVDDAGHTIIRTLSGPAAEPLREDMLKLLLEGSSLIQSSEDEQSLHESLVQIASRGTGLPNAAVLRVLDATGMIEILAQRSSPQASTGPGGYSRSLLAAAAQGQVAELSAAAPDDISHSIIQMNVQAAICAPLMLGTTAAAYLYVDSRGSPAGGLKTLRPNASGFCQALARMGGLALANLKRIETEMRIVRMEAELQAAAVAQNMMLPRGPVTSGKLTCSGKSRPSTDLGGDFFDAIALPDGKLIVALGDVSGHGAEASVLMTAALGFLRAAFGYHQDVARAVTDLNGFIQSHCRLGKFISLWVGLFDESCKELSYVDAGHGFALLLGADGDFKSLDANEGMGLNVDPDKPYRAATEKLEPGQRLLIISDGIKEQPQAQLAPDGSRIEFGMEKVKSFAAEGSDDIVDRLFQALFEFAGTKELADDATAVLVRWS